MVDSPQELDSAVKEFEDDILTWSKPFVPKTKRSSLRKHWWNNHLTTIHKELRRLQRKVHKKRTRSNEDISHLITLRNAKKREMELEIIKAKKRSWSNFLSKTSSYSMWNNLKKITSLGKSVKLSHVVDTETGNILDDPMEIVQALSRRFFPHQVPNHMPPLYDNSDCLAFQDPNFRPFSEDEVYRSIHCNKAMGAVGPDKLPNEVFRRSAYFIVPILTRLMNTLIRMGHHVIHWRIADVICIPKSKEIVEFMLTNSLLLTQ